MAHARDEIYYYDQKLGNPRAAFRSASDVHPEAVHPEIPATFVTTVEGETLINSMWGKRAVRWRAEPGTKCVILGYWSDDTVQLRWPAILGAYRVDGRFPSWVVAEDPTAKMAGGGHMLPANDLPPPKRLVNRLAAFLHRSTE